MTTRTEKALAAVEQLTEMIRLSYVAAFASDNSDLGVFSNVTRLSFSHDSTNTTVIEELQKLTRVKFQATAVEVLKFVRARAPGVSSERVRVAFKERLRAGVWRSGNQRSGSVVSQQ